MTPTALPAVFHLVLHEPGGLRYVVLRIGAYSIFLRGRARCPSNVKEASSSALMIPAFEAVVSETDAPTEGAEDAGGAAGGGAAAAAAAAAASSSLARC